MTHPLDLPTVLIDPAESDDTASFHRALAFGFVLSAPFWFVLGAVVYLVVWG